MPLDITKVRKLIGDRTLGEVAAQAKMMQPALSRILAGKFDPKLSTIERLAKALGVHAMDILN